LLDLVFYISVPIIPDVLADARSVSDQTAVLGTALKEILCRMRGSRNLGEFKLTKPLSDIVDHWTQKHFTLFHTLRCTNDFRQAEVLSCV